MACQIVIVLSDGDRYELMLHDSDLAGCDKHSADDWLAREFETAGCEPASPMGKLILPDKVLQLGRTVTAKMLAAPTPWLKEYLRAVACALGKPFVSIDLVESKIGY
ncbi:MAG: hypothetical protein KJ787_13245 [Gammaproteobacteria bacterium]|nr:hypothetical protein [Gammaproteobacteria bacterium]MBU1647290.1 hypothetical protein [Gammaproteobacteria bacterium]MBU1972802.1 hypothetical protein [Gammaproteobacteria bacterium]